MQEAKFSLNIRFNIRGYDTQLTLRDDESGNKLLSLLPQVLKNLENLGATPERRWETNGKNGKQEAGQELQPEPIECPLHHKAVKSKFGGLYCPTKNKDGSYCDWKVEVGE